MRWTSKPGGARCSPGTALMPSKVQRPIKSVRGSACATLPRCEQYALHCRPRQSRGLHWPFGALARQILSAMPDIRPGGGKTVNPEFMDQPGTYRGDLMNKRAPDDRESVHPELRNGHPHRHSAHYNITLRDPKDQTNRIKAAILICDD